MTDYELLSAKLCYDPETGIVSWKSSGVPATKEYCVDGKHNYLKVQVLGMNYYAHRVAVLLMTEHWPKDRVDHRDDDGTNNKWNNLREADHSHNMANMSRQKRGVRKHGKRFQARLSYYGSYMSLGCYDTYEEAEVAYKAGLEKYYGEFSTFNREVA